MTEKQKETFWRRQRMSKKRTIIEVYPDCEKPEWLKVGVQCKVWGEGNDILTVTHIGKNAVMMDNGKRSHGWESIKKLHSPQNYCNLTQRQNYDEAYELASKICEWLGMKETSVTFYDLPRGPTTNDEVCETLGEMIYDTYKKFENEV